MGLTAKQLIEFEDEIAAEFEHGHIKAPVHLAGGNEQQLIDIFGQIGAADHVLCGWRSHYHCLLKGVPREKVKAAILAGHSISLCFPEYRVLSSGIVGGICPIAVGLAWAIRKRGGSEHVYAFLGDMSFESGIYGSSAKYAARHNLPVTWIRENNEKSVSTFTQAVWGPFSEIPDVISYDYTMTRAHVGIGKWVCL